MTEQPPTARDKLRLIVGQVVIGLMVIGVLWYVVAHLTLTATVHVTTTTP